MLYKNQHYCIASSEPTLLHRFARTTLLHCFTRTKTTKPHRPLHKNQHYYTASQQPTLLHRFAKTYTITLLAASQIKNPNYRTLISKWRDSPGIRDGAAKVQLNLLRELLKAAHAPEERVQTSAVLFRAIFGRHLEHPQSPTGHLRADLQKKNKHP